MTFVGKWLDRVLPARAPVPGNEQQFRLLVEGVTDYAIYLLSPEGVVMNGAQQTILLVEDQAKVRELTAIGLRELGYNVLEAGNAETALALLDAREDIVLLFTDVVMPNMDGRRLADEALRQRPHLRVLFMTGFTKNAIIHRGMLDPGTNFIAKPFTLEDLAQKVREAIEP
jgi:CheY-like chemotaxis protein